MDALAKTPGRKAVVLLSERLSLSPGADAGEQAAAEFSSTRISQLAGLGMAVFYAIRVNGSAAPAGSRADAWLDTGLVAVTKETGGLWIEDEAGVSAALSRVLQDQAEHYRIAFRPEGHIYDYASGRDRVDKIAVKTARPGVRLRARTVVYARAEEDAVPPFPPDAGDEDQESLVTSPFEGSAIGLDVSYAFFYSASEGAYLEVVMRVDAQRVTYVRSQSGEYRCALQVASMAFDSDGRPLGDTGRGVAYVLTEAQYQNVVAHGVVYTQKLPLRKPGAYQVRAVVRDVPTGRYGAAGRYVEIPDVKRGDFAMSGIESQPGSSPIRIFKPGASFAYTYQLYNLSANGEKRCEAEIQSRLYRAGAEVFVGKPTVVAFASANSSTHVVNGTISLGADMTPGRYILQVTATDKLAGKARTASQFIDLEVRP
jgi:hypothetical protein